MYNYTKQQLVWMFSLGNKVCNWKIVLYFFLKTIQCYRSNKCVLQQRVALLHFFNQSCIPSPYLQNNSMYGMIFCSASLIWEFIWLKVLSLLPYYFCNSNDLCPLKQQGDSVLAHRDSASYQPCEQPRKTP